MARMLNWTSRLPFTSSDEAYLHSRFTAVRKKRKHIYDIQLAGGWQENEGVDALDKGIVTLSSKNLRYDFALVHVGGGRGLFGTKKTVIEIYVRKQGCDRYSLLKVVSSLPKALAVIDRIYDEAAARHLP